MYKRLTENQADKEVKKAIEAWIRTPSLDD
jgi:hypothetical protein